MARLGFVRGFEMQRLQRQNNVLILNFLGKSHKSWKQELWSSFLITKAFPEGWEVQVHEGDVLEHPVSTRFSNYGSCMWLIPAPLILGL